MFYLKFPSYSKLTFCLVFKDHLHDLLLFHSAYLIYQILYFMSTFFLIFFINFRWYIKVWDMQLFPNCSSNITNWIYKVNTFLNLFFCYICKLFSQVAPLIYHPKIVKSTLFFKVFCDTRRGVVLCFLYIPMVLYFLDFFNFF